MRRNRLLPHIFTVAIMGLSGTWAIGSCTSHEGSESQLKEDVDSFATYYYNWHFKQAARYCTPESEAWLRYAASNVHDADIDLLRQKNEDATVTIEDVDFQDDTLAIVKLNVKDFLQMDTIGKPASHADEATFRLSMVIHEGKWKVRMGGLPQSERQSHG